MYREPAPMPPDAAAMALVARQRTGLLRARFVALALALVVPALFFLLFERQARRLDALADHGIRVDAIVTSAETSRYTHYEYEIEGVAYRWNVAREAAPLPLGATLPVRVLPEVPSFSRPGETGDGAAREAAANRVFYPRILLGMGTFFVGIGALAHTRLRRLARGERPPQPDLRLVARGVALVLLLVALGVNADPKVRAVHAAAFGARPLGGSPWLVVSLVETLLFLPFFPILEHVVRIAAYARRDGAGVGPIGLVLYAATLGNTRPELVRSRAIAFAGFVYFAAIVGAWIVFTSAKGI